MSISVASNTDFSNPKDAAFPCLSVDGFGLLASLVVRLLRALRVTGSRPRRPRGRAKAPDRPQMLSQCHKTPPAAKSQSQTKTKIPSFRSSTPFVASFDSEPMSFFVRRITRPVALLTWPAGMEKRGNGWCSIPGQGPNNPGG